MFGLLRLMVLVPLLIVVTPIVLIAVALVLVFAGSPGACGGGRVIATDPALAAAYDQRWLAFNAQLTQGLPATIAVSEDEATARSRVFLAASDAPVKDVRVCFTEGGGDINGTISAPFGTDVAVRAKGAVDLGGASPRAEITSMRIGALPRFVTKPFEGLVSSIVDDQLEQIIIFNDMTVEVHDGEAVLTGQP